MFLTTSIEKNLSQVCVHYHSVFMDHKDSILVWSQKSNNARHEYRYEYIGWVTALGWNENIVNFFPEYFFYHNFVIYVTYSGM